MRRLELQRPPLTPDIIRTRRQEQQVVSVRHQCTSDTITNRINIDKGMLPTGTSIDTTEAKSESMPPERSEKAHH